MDLAHLKNMWVKSTKKSNAVGWVPPVSNQECLLDALKSLPLPRQLDTAHDVSATKETRCKPSRITCDNSPSRPHSKPMSSYCRTAAYCDCLPVSPSYFHQVGALPFRLLGIMLPYLLSLLLSIPQSVYPSSILPHFCPFQFILHDSGTREDSTKFSSFLPLGTWYNCMSAFYFIFLFFPPQVSQATQLSLMNEVWAEVIYFLSGWKLSKLVNNLPSPLRSLTVMETHWSFSAPWSQVRSRGLWMTHMVLWSCEWATSLYDGKPLGPEAHLRWSWWMASACAHMCTHTRKLSLIG